MSEFISVADVCPTGFAREQKEVRDEVAGIAFRLRREMDRGLTPDEMKVVREEAEAAQAAEEILSRIFE